MSSDSFTDTYTLLPLFSPFIPNCFPALPHFPQADIANSVDVTTIPNLNEANCCDFLKDILTTLDQGPAKPVILPTWNRNQAYALILSSSLRNNHLFPQSYTYAAESKLCPQYISCSAKDSCFVYAGQE